MIKLSKTTELPTDFAGRRSAIFGMSGSGKSNTVTVVLEELARNGEQFVLIDPKGEGFGLLSLRDGKPSNLDVIVFGEPNGHIGKITEHHGPEIADFVVSSGQSAVLSLAGFPSDQSERRFVTEFLKRLYRQKNRVSQRSRTLVVFEEAHLFMPEHASGASAELSGACQRIVRQGRSAGLGSLIVDQRPQDVSKRAISQCDIIICHSLTHELDRKALDGWVKGFDRENRSHEFLSSLASLEPGEAWIWAPPSFTRTKVSRRKTYDSGASPDGKAAVKVRRKDIDLDKLADKFATLVEEAKANDPAELKKQIAELKGQLKSQSPDRAAIATAVSLARRDWEAEAQETRKQLRAAQEKLNAIIKLAGAPTVFDTMETALAPLAKPPEKQTVARGPFPLPRVIPTPPIERKPVISVSEPTELADGQVRILKSLYWLAHEDRTPVKVAFYADLKLGGHFNNLIGKLRSSGLVRGWELTERGAEELRRAAADVEPKPTGYQLREWLRPKLADGHNRMLDALIVAGGARMSNEDLAAASGLNLGGHFNNLLGKLRTMQIAEGLAKDGGVRAHPLFFS